MKTLLPESIKTVAEAEEFLYRLCKNKEEYHPEDDAHDIEWRNLPADQAPTSAECEQLNRLMDDIYKLPGNENIQSMVFDPCGFILDMDIKKSYQVKFRDVFSFAVDYRTCEFTGLQYRGALKDMENKALVVNKLINHCRVQLVIEEITETSLPVASQA